MDGVAALRAVLVANEDIVAMVPSSRIQSGVMGPGTPLPAIAITSVSKVDRNIPWPGADRHVVERVQVTVLAADYPSQKAVLRAVRAAAADTSPIVPGIDTITIHTDGAGPDFLSDDAAIYFGTQDFRVDFNEAR